MCEGHKSAPFALELCEPKPKRAAPSESSILTVFEHYRRYHPRALRRPHEKLPEWQKIKDRLREGYSVDELCTAIDGCHVRPWNRGENPSGTRYDSLSLIMRSAQKVQQYLEAWDRRAEWALSEKTRRGLRAGLNWAESDDPTRPQGICDVNPEPGRGFRQGNGRGSV